MNNTYNNYETFLPMVFFLNSYKENMQANSIINFLEMSIILPNMYYRWLLYQALLSVQ